MNGWHLRNDMDAQIVRNVYVGNEYGVPDALPDWTVLDIGGHVGSFARLCAERGARVLSCEPDPDNATLFCRNVAVLSGCVRLVRAAAMPVFGTVPLWAWCGDHACRTTTPGGHTLHQVPAVTLDWLALEAGGVVDLCKIDCEGAEYNLIAGCDFSWARRLIVEFHDFGRCGDAPHRADVCRTRLASLGFAEKEFTPIHTGDGHWYRLYKGEREAAWANKAFATELVED